MSQDRIDHPQDPKGASRRSRKDEQGRDYVCGCGKRYLSYPALYTHIKTKHDGHQPEGTQKTGVAPVSRRAKQKIDDKIIKQIFNLVQIQNLKILSQLDENAAGSVPMGSRIKRQSVGKQMVQVYQNLTKLNSLILDKKSPLENVLVCYLVGVGQYVSQAMFHYYCIFARLFRSCFHDCGQQIYDTCFRTNDQRKDKVFILQQCKMAPIICDFFLRFYVPYENKDVDFQSIMQLICYDFCQWMYENKLTIVEVSMKKPYQISRRNIIEAKSKQNKKSEEGQSVDQDNQKQSQEHSMNESQGEKNQMQQQKRHSVKQVEQPIDQMEVQNNNNENNPANPTENKMQNEDKINQKLQQQ